MAKRMIKLTTIIGILLLAVLVFAACSSSQPSGGKQENEQPKQSSSQPSEATEAEKKVEDDYPNKPIEIAVPFSAGGSGDTMTRVFAKIAEKHLGQPIAVVNKPGGSGALAIKYVEAKPADGYTILYHSSTLPFTMASGGIPYTPEDVQPVAVLVSNYQVLTVPADSPFKSFEDFVKYGKENPGKLKVGGSGTHGTNHVFALKIFDEAGIEADYVTYDGGSEVLRAILGGNVDATASSGEVVTQEVDAGKLRLLGISTAERFEERPDVPTFKEMGLTSIDDELIWRAFFAKPGVPKERLEKFNAVVAQVVEDPEWQKYLENTKQQKYYRSFEEFTKIFNNYYDSGKRLFEKLK